MGRVDFTRWAEFVDGPGSLVTTNVDYCREGNNSHYENLMVNGACHKISKRPFSSDKKD
jgi:hypothetical protein